MIEHNKVLIQDFSDKPRKGVVHATHSAAQLVGGYLIPPLILVGTQQTQGRLGDLELKKKNTGLVGGL